MICRLLVLFCAILVAGCSASRTVWLSAASQDDMKRLSELLMPAPVVFIGEFHDQREGRLRGVLLYGDASSSVALKARGIDTSTVDAIILTHLHGDHFGGIPFVMLDGQFLTRREKPLLIEEVRVDGKALEVRWEDASPAAEATGNPVLEARPLALGPGRHVGELH